MAKSFEIALRDAFGGKKKQQKKTKKKLKNKCSKLYSAGVLVGA